MAQTWLGKHLLRLNSEQFKDSLFCGAVFSFFWIFCRVAAGFTFGWISYAVSARILVLTLLFCILRESVRAILISVIAATPLKRAGAFIITFIVLSVAMVPFGTSFAGQNIVNVLFLTVLPAFFSSLMLTYLSMSGGMIPCAIYSIVTSAFPMIIRLEPNLTDRFQGILGILVPVLCIIILDWCIPSEKKQRRVDEKYLKKVPKGRKKLREGRRRVRRYQWLARIPGILGLLALIAFICFFAGVFPWYPVSVITGSMVPNIMIGDVAVVSSLEKTPEVGDIIQFSRDGVSVIHRIVSVEEVDGETVYITRGDANNANDSGYVSDEDLLGTVKFIIPKLGKLAMWFHGADELDGDSPQF